MSESSKKIETVREFILFVDTNSIWTADENIGRLDLLPVQFQQQWERISKLGDVQLAIPDVVLFELAYQKQRQILKAYKEARTNLRKIETALSLGTPDIPELDLGRIGHAVQANLRRQVKEIPYCQSVSIPYDAIAKNIKGIVDRSLWRLPPFKEGNSEAGFRDALVLETIRYFHSNLIHNDIAFITKDIRLRDAILREFSSVKNFGLFSDLDEYESFLDLARCRYLPEFLHSVTMKAKDTFAQSAWFGGGIEKQLVESYGLIVGNLAFEQPKEVTLGALKQGLFGLGSASPARECAGEPSHHFGSTKLLAVVGEGEFHWSTSVLLITPYTPLLGLPSSLVNPQDVNFRILILFIEWKAVVTETQDFTDIALLRHKQIFETYEHSLESASSYQSTLDLI